MTDREDISLGVHNRAVILDLDNESRSWRYGEKPDYTKSEERLAKHSKYNHTEGSLAAIAQNLVRVFEMEASFKENPSEWCSIAQEKFVMQTNNGRAYTAEEIANIGTYNTFLPKSEHYDPEREDFQSSADVFHTAFPEGFLWELVEVYSAPPVVTFKWRHWGEFTGHFKSYDGTGKTIEIVGVSVAHVNDRLQIERLEHYFDNSKFLQGLTAGCPFHNNGGATQ
ncbi:SnoaL-like polyketide cyclase [Cyanosarcina cf. burmensis CCALA 770]|nr:SnoaL-like polyketide cyclase [Cyanosarcina cf. burmensis CCALA 770]